MARVTKEWFTVTFATVSGLRAHETFPTMAEAEAFLADNRYSDMWMSLITRLTSRSQTIVRAYTMNGGVI